MEDNRRFSNLQAGVGLTDITPWAGVQLAGDVGRYRPARYILDRLHARAIVLSTPECKVGILAADLCVLLPRLFWAPLQMPLSPT